MPKAKKTIEEPVEEIDIPQMPVIGMTNKFEVYVNGNHVIGVSEVHFLWPAASGGIPTLEVSLTATANDTLLSISDARSLHIKLYNAEGYEAVTYSMSVVRTMVRPNNSLSIKDESLAQVVILMSVVSFNLR